MLQFETENAFIEINNKQYIIYYSTNPLEERKKNGTFYITVLIHIFYNEVDEELISILEKNDKLKNVIELTNDNQYDVEKFLDMKKIHSYKHINSTNYEKLYNVILQFKNSFSKEQLNNIVFKSQAKYGWLFYCKLPEFPMLKQIKQF